MLSRWRCVLALAVIPALTAGCGGSHHAHRPAVPSALLSYAGSASALPSADTSSCTVYESGYATQVIFASDEVDVRPECRTWIRIRNDPGDGYLWGYAPPRNISGAGGVSSCRLTDPQGLVSAGVIEDVGFVRLSEAQRARGASACARMRAAGWIDARRRTARVRHARR